MTEAQIAGLILTAVGLFSVAGAYFNWDWYMNNYRARFFVNLFGRRGARIFYAVLGTAMFIFGVTQLLS